MSDLIIWTYDWVPVMPRGFVRDMRLRGLDLQAMRRGITARRM